MDKDSAEEVYQTGQSGNLDNTQLITLKLEIGSYIRFQVDTWPRCNVISLGMYIRASKDHHLQNIKPAQQQITAYGGTTNPVCGTTLLRVWRENYHCKLNCKLVDKEWLHPILGRKACLCMRIVTYLDNDDLNKPPVENARIYAVDDKRNPLTKEGLIQ